MSIENTFLRLKIHFSLQWNNSFYPKCQHFPCHQKSKLSELDCNPQNMICRATYDYHWNGSLVAYCMITLCPGKWYLPRTRRVGLLHRQWDQWRTVSHQMEKSHQSENNMFTLKSIYCEIEYIGCTLDLAVPNSSHWQGWTIWSDSFCQYWINSKSKIFAKRSELSYFKCLAFFSRPTL